MDITKQLQKLKRLEPDDDFVRRAKTEVLAAPTPQHMFPSLAFAGGFAALALVAALITTLLSTSVPTVSALDAEDLKSELKNIYLEFQLDEIQYNQDANQIISNALSEIGGETNHMNEDLIQKEQDAVGMPEMEPSEDEINQLLEEVLKQ